MLKLRKLIKKNDASQVAYVYCIARTGNKVFKAQINSNGAATAAPAISKTTKTALMISILIFYRQLLKVQVVIYRKLGIPSIKVT